MKLSIVNENLIEYCFAESISIQTSELVISVYGHLRESLDYQKLGLIGITPCFTSLAIAFEKSSPLFHEPDSLREPILQAMASPKITNSKTHTIAITYNGMDMEVVCQSLQLSKEEFVQCHKSSIYMVAMLGFKGNFPYLLGLDKKLAVPRRASPRNIVKKGSVAIGADQCGIYPEDSPGGWHIIANTEFDAYEDLRAGDRIVFEETHAN